MNNGTIEDITNSEAIGHAFAQVHPNTALYTVAVGAGSYDPHVAALVSRARALITVVHADPHLNAGLAYATLLPPAALLLAVKSRSFRSYPLSPEAYAVGLFTDLQQGADLRCAAAC